MTFRVRLNLFVWLAGVCLGTGVVAPALIAAQESAAAENWIESLSDPSFKIRLKAVLLIGKYKINRAAPKLIKLLKDEQETVRAAAALTLGQLGELEARGELVVLLSQTAPLVVDAAEKALSMLDTAKGKPKFMLALAAPTLAGGVPSAMGPSLMERLKAKLRLRSEVILGAGEETILTGPRLSSHLKKRSLTGFLLNPRITRLQSKAIKGTASVTCEVSVMVATLVDKRMEFAVNGSATAEVEGGSLSDDERDELYVTLLEAAANAAVENVLDRLNKRSER